ncbi:ECF sigma factor FemI [Oxalicibacterium flavum]|uniref:ECF sigma factor FemI n=1 Tax=Oxalicibacterium flavum TaxID=179467 RepID=A0A8J2XZM0_9BURK|nr:sigma-70 family RNA polymerase sigma factor [Oxalicibacterium flavum]GGC12884.1 ECF sigma factor FemI [Oxalicibacterium flavum]
MPVADHPHHDQLIALYSDHHGWLLGWLRRKIGNTFDAADLAQDTFARIMVSRELGTVQEPRAYLTTIAKGLVVNWYQRQALERSYLDALAAMPEEQAPSAEQRCLILETLHEIDRMLDALPAKVRQAFLLSQLEGMKYEDIARQLDVSLISVKRYMKQAFLHCLAVIE